MLSNSVYELTNGDMFKLNRPRIIVGIVAAHLNVANLLLWNSLANGVRLGQGRELC